MFNWCVVVLMLLWWVVIVLCMVWMLWVCSVWLFVGWIFVFMCRLVCVVSGVCRYCICIVVFLFRCIWYGVFVCSRWCCWCMLVLVNRFFSVSSGNGLCWGSLNRCCVMWLVVWICLFFCMVNSFCSGECN